MTEELKQIKTNMLKMLEDKLTAINNNVENQVNAELRNKQPEINEKKQALDIALANYIKAEQEAFNDMIQAKRDEVNNKKNLIVESYKEQIRATINDGNNALRKELQKEIDALKKELKD